MHTDEPPFRSDAPAGPVLGGAAAVLGAWQVKMIPKGPAYSYQSKCKEPENQAALQAAPVTEWDKSQENAQVEK